MQKLILCKKFYFFRCFSSRSGGSGAVTNLASERLVFFNNVVEQRTAIANSTTSLPANLESLPIIIHSTRAPSIRHVDVRDFSERFWSYRKYYELPVQNSDSISSVTANSFTTSLLGNPLPTKINPLNTIPRYNDGSPIDVKLKLSTRLYHMAGDEVGGLYENAVVIPVPQDSLTQEHEGLREVGNLMNLYINERSDFRTMFKNPHEIEPELEILKPLGDALINSDRLHLGTLSRYQMEAQANHLRVTELNFESLSSVLNLFSTEGLKQIKLIFESVLYSEVHFSAFTLFTMSFTGLWLMVLPIVDLALVPINVFYNRLMLRVDEILLNRSLDSFSSLVTTRRNPALTMCEEDRRNLHGLLD